MDKTRKMGLIIALIVLLPLLLAGCVTLPLGNQNSLKLKQEKAQATERPVNVSPDSPGTERYLVSVFAFHDFNGNGKRDRWERAVKGIRISTTGLSGITDRGGRSDLGYLPEGTYNLAVHDPSGRFMYILPSVSEVRPIGDGLKIAIDGDAEVLVPLGVGFLSSPFDSREVYQFVDLDQRGNQVIDWRGRKQTFNGHSGIDVKSRKAYAAAPGWIISAEDDWENDQTLRYPGNRVIILHSTGFATAYNHLGTLNPDIRKINIEDGRRLWFNGEFDKLQHIPRGQELGSIGLTGNTTGLHLHFEVNKEPWQRQGRSMYYTGVSGGWASGEVIDPYRWSGRGPLPSKVANSVSLWIIENRPR